jgi:hypothetical protein
MMGKNTIENVGDLMASAVGKAWREVTEQDDPPSKRSGGRLSGVRGVIVGAGLGVLAAKKAGPLIQDAMLKFVASHGAGAADQAASGAANQAGSASGAAGQAASGAAGQAASGAADQAGSASGPANQAASAGQAAQGSTGA